MLKICKEDRNLQMLKLVCTCSKLAKRTSFANVEISEVTEVVDNIEDSASGELRSH